MDQTNTTNRERRQERKEYDRTYGCMEVEDGLGLRKMKNLKLEEVLLWLGASIESL